MNRRNEMSRSDSLEALRRANPRREPAFTGSVAAADSMRDRIVTSPVEVRFAAPPAARSGRHRRPRRLVLVPAALTFAVAAILAVFLVVGSSLPTRSASAAVRHAADVTSASAASSGTAVVVITNGGVAWANRTIRWYDGDVDVFDHQAPTDLAQCGEREMRVVDGTLYACDPMDRGWMDLGDPSHIDPGSGTTPGEYLAATRQDIDGTTLQRITGGMTGLTAQQTDDGSTVYRGSVPAGLIATESGFKEGEHIRVFPFGLVAHGRAADPHAGLDTAVTVNPVGVITEIAVDWGSGDSAWRYTVTYRDLGTTPAIEVPPNARSIFDLRTPGAPPTNGGA
jgi:hypothetical protein